MEVVYGPGLVGRKQVGFSRPGQALPTSPGAWPLAACVTCGEALLFPGTWFPHVRSGTTCGSMDGLGGVVGSVTPPKLYTKPCERIVFGNEPKAFLRSSKGPVSVKRQLLGLQASRPFPPYCSSARGLSSSSLVAWALRFHKLLS